MKIKLKELIEAKASFEKILSKEIPFKLAYRCRKIINKLNSELSEYNETRNEIIKALGEEMTDEKTGEIVKGKMRVKKENIEEFRKQEADALAVEIELGADLIPYEALESLTISPIDLAVIDKFIAEPQSE